MLRSAPLYRASSRNARARVTPTKPKIGNFSTPNISTNMDPLEAALALLESLRPREKPNYAITARKFGINRSTLLWRHKGV